MMLTSSVQHAVIIISALRKEPHVLVPSYKIAKDNNVSLAFVDQICRKLKHAGIIKSNRGPGGGYALANPTKDISILELMDLLTDSKTRTVHPQVVMLNKKFNNLLDTIKV